MQITLTGGTGFIGAHLAAKLVAGGHTVKHLTRSPAGRPGYFAWNPDGGPPPEEALSGSQAVIHLAGEPVAQRWTPEVKRAIRTSRVDATRGLVHALSTLSPRPEVLVSASAVGYYGSRGDEVLTEESAPGRGFLAATCTEWEQAARLAESLGIRVVCIRIGVVLGPGGGALQQMLPPFRLGIGGPLAGGRQWMPWIHRDDLCSLALWAVQESAVSGPVNAVGPQPVRNSEFTAALGVALRRPAFLPVPRFSLSLLYGEMSEIVVASQRALPQRAQSMDFRFSFPEIDAALRQILS